MILADFLHILEVGCLPEDMIVSFRKTEKDSFDSNDERYMFWWLMAAKERGYVNHFFQPEQIVLLPSIGAYTSRKAKRGDRLIYKHKKINSRPTRYRPDFVINFSKQYVTDNLDYFQIVELNPVNDSPLEILHDGAKTLFTVFPYFGNYLSIIDIKPEVKFARNGASHRDFPIKQNILWAIHTILVTEFVLIKNKVPILFRELGTPKRYLFSDLAKQGRKLHYTLSTTI